MVANLRPNCLADFIGKPNITENLSIYIKSAVIGKKPLDHCLFYGLPGTGKTSLAYVIANELNHKIKTVQGNSIQRTIDIINLVLTLSENDILFIDEIHAINPQCVELLYSIMEDFVIDVAIGKDFNTKVTRIKIPKFTLIGATTMLGRVPQPLEDRFGIVINLGSYSNEEIFQILTKLNEKNKCLLTESDILKISQNSKGIPRIGIRLFKRIIDFRNVNKRIGVNSILKKLGINKNGVDENDIKYLKCLQKSNAPTGVKVISQTINVDPQTIETKIEHHLLSLNLIERTNRGRILTDDGRNFLLKIVT